MEVKDILDLNTIKTDIDATNKDEALKELSQLLLENDYISNVEGFMKDIYLREAQGETGLGNYIAIPHGNSKFVNKIGVAIGISNEQIPWETLDGKGVKVIILFAVSDNNEGPTDHLKMLSMFARKLGNDEVIEELLKSEKPEDVITSFIN